MDKRVYFLMIISFVVGMVELIISGILDLIADDLNVTLAQAGSLITIFALIFAIASPILLIMTAKVERKRLTLICLYTFLVGSIMTVFSPTFTILFIARLILAFSGALLIILCLVMAPALVEPQYRGRAIGIVSMGVSASLVLGVPIGLFFGNAFGWRAPFVLVTALTAISILGVHLFMNRAEPKPPIPLILQLESLKSQKILLALFTTFLYMAGHSIMYTYFKPYIEETTSFSGNWIGAIYLIFGIAAVFGGGIGGIGADKFGTKKTIAGSLVIFSIVFFILPASESVMPLYFLSIIVWGILSWAISPAMQSYLIETSPKTAEIQQSLNNSALHLGIAFGSAVGGFVINHFSILANPIAAGILVICSLFTAIISVRKGQALPAAGKA